MLIPKGLVSLQVLQLVCSLFISTLSLAGLQPALNDALWRLSLSSEIKQIAFLNMDVKTGSFSPRLQFFPPFPLGFCTITEKPIEIFLFGLVCVYFGDSSLFQVTSKEFFSFCIMVFETGRDTFVYVDYLKKRALILP